MNSESTTMRSFWRDRLVQIQAGLLIPIVEIWMRKRSFRRCQAGLIRMADLFPRVSSPPSIERAQSIAALVDTGNRRYSLYIADCLTRSLVLQYMLRRRNIPATLRLGVRTITGQFEAHAWVEYEGSALNELEDVRTVYAPFDWTHPLSGKGHQ